MLLGSSVTLDKQVLQSKPSQTLASTFETVATILVEKLPPSSARIKAQYQRNQKCRYDRCTFLLAKQVRGLFLLAEELNQQCVQGFHL
ncbi:hypothetical protein OK016_13145 [Vibrio chagasii]|nr:hypothetical protein [Vibrio chagasii]